MSRSGECMSKVHHPWVDAKDHSHSLPSLRSQCVSQAKEGVRILWIRRDLKIRKYNWSKKTHRPKA